MPPAGGPGRAEREHRPREGARARRERRQRAEARLRLRLTRDGAALAAHRGGPLGTGGSPTVALDQRLLDLEEHLSAREATSKRELERHLSSLSARLGYFSTRIELVEAASNRQNEALELLQGRTARMEARIDGYWREFCALGLRQDETNAEVQKTVQRLAQHTSEVDVTFAELQDKLSKVTATIAEHLTEKFGDLLTERLAEALPEVVMREAEHFNAHFGELFGEHLTEKFGDHFDEHLTEKFGELCRPASVAHLVALPARMDALAAAADKDIRALTARIDDVSDLIDKEIPALPARIDDLETNLSEQKESVQRTLASTTSEFEEYKVWARSLFTAAGAKIDDGHSILGAKIGDVHSLLALADEAGHDRVTRKFGELAEDLVTFHARLAKTEAFVRALRAEVFRADDALHADAAARGAPGVD